MDTPIKQILSKAAVRKDLKVSRARYDQLIESGILPQAFEITPGSRPVHTARHVELARLNLNRLATREYFALERARQVSSSKPVKPIKLKPNEQIKIR